MKITCGVNKCRRNKRTRKAVKDQNLEFHLRVLLVSFKILKCLGRGIFPSIFNFNSLHLNPNVFLKIPYL